MAEASNPMEESSWSVGVGFIAVLLVIYYAYSKYTNIETYYMTFSYSDVVTKSQWWRMITSNVCYTSIWQFVVCLLTLLSLFPLEQLVGTSYMLKYTLLLLFFEKFIFLGLLHLFTKRLRPGLYDWMLTIPHYSMTGILFAWIAYQSISADTSLLFLYFPIPSYLSLLIHSAVFNTLLLQHSEPVSQISGILAGFALRIGWLELLPSMYWICCFVFNASLAIAWSLAMSYDENIDDSNHDVAEHEVVNFV